MTTSDVQKKSTSNEISKIGDIHTNVRTYIHTYKPAASYQA